MILSLIAAIGNQRQLGLKGSIPWHLPEELQYFKKLTMDHHLLMGRKTFQSLPRPLPGRTHLVLSRHLLGKLPERCLAITSLQEALEIAQKKGETELFVCGGADIYSQTLSLANRLYLSRIDYSGPADTFFPPWEHLDWEHLSTHTGNSFQSLTYKQKKATRTPNE